jgi:hypothetical protein
MARRIYCVTNDAGESMFVLADTILEALDLWRDENEQAWPASCAIVYEGTILGEHNGR